MPTLPAESNVLENSAPPPRARYAELDSLRGIAALIVVFYHFRAMWVGDQPLAGWHKWLDLLTKPLTSGPQAVKLFFILSGFVLSVPFLRGKAQKYPAFLTRRVLRIYGPYLGALALAVAGNAIWHGSLGHGEWSNLTWFQPVQWNAVLQHVIFIGNYDAARFNTAFWSLVVEMRISILFAVVVYSKPVVSVAGAVGLCIVPALLLHNDPQLLNIQITIQTVGIFVAGILLASHVDKIIHHCQSLGSYGRTVVAIISLGLYIGGAHFVRGSGEKWGIDVLLSTVGAAGILILAISAGRPNILHASIPRFLGRISYSLYLVHSTVLFALTYAFKGVVGPAVQFPFYLFTALALAFAFCLLIEEPFMRLSRRVGSRVSFSSYESLPQHPSSSELL